MGNRQPDRQTAQPPHRMSQENLRGCAQAPQKVLMRFSRSCGGTAYREMSDMALVPRPTPRPSSPPPSRVSFAAAALRLNEGEVIRTTDGMSRVRLGHDEVEVYADHAAGKLGAEHPKGAFKNPSHDKSQVHSSHKHNIVTAASRAVPFILNAGARPLRRAQAGGRTTPRPSGRSRARTERRL